MSIKRHPRTFAIALGGTRDWTNRKFPTRWKNGPGDTTAIPLAHPRHNRRRTTNLNAFQAKHGLEGVLL